MQKLFKRSVIEFSKNNQGEKLSKLLLIEKTIFHGTDTKKLCDFVKKYNVVATYILGAECLISENCKSSKKGKAPDALLKRFDKIIKSGAKVGYSPADLLKAEMMTLCPVKSIVDKNTTVQVRKSTLNIDIDFLKQEAECCRQTFKPKINGLFEIAEKMYNNACKKDLQKKFCQENKSKKRFTKWFQVTDQKMNDIMKHLFPEISSKADANWFTWQMARLWFVYSFERTYKRSKSGPSYENPDRSNDFYDIIYITYLSKVDGILTKEESLIVPLAQAAFPEKDVFYSLDEVPDEYSCHWS
jgi:hypothetical protein